MENAVKEGQQEAEPIIERGRQEEEAILGLNDGRLDKAINMVIERIVNSNGNS